MNNHELFYLLQESRRKINMYRMVIRWLTAFGVVLTVGAIAGYIVNQSDLVAHGIVLVTGVLASSIGSYALWSMRDQARELECYVASVLLEQQESESILADLTREAQENNMGYTYPPKPKNPDKGQR